MLSTERGCCGRCGARLRRLSLCSTVATLEGGALAMWEIGAPRWSGQPVRRNLTSVIGTTPMVLAGRGGRSVLPKPGGAVPLDLTGALSSRRTT